MFYNVNKKNFNKKFLKIVQYFSFIAQKKKSKGFHKYMTLGQAKSGFNIFVLDSVDWDASFTGSLPARPLVMVQSYWAHQAKQFCLPLQFYKPPDGMPYSVMQISCD